MEPYPSFPSYLSCPPAELPAPAKTRRKPTWFLYVGLSAAVLLLGIWYARTWLGDDGGGQDFAGLPEWFDRAHRIKQTEQVTRVEGIGLLLPPASSSSEFSPQWLEKNFTHYFADNAFVWATPRKRIPPDGKIFAGTKVILGKHVGNFSLVCTVTKDGQAINLFVQTPVLRARSQGPPTLAPASDD